MLFFLHAVSWFSQNNKKNEAEQLFEGSCDTEDWSNDAENSALITEINYILTCIQIQNCSFKLQ